MSTTLRDFQVGVKLHGWLIETSSNTRYYTNSQHKTHVYPALLDRDAERWKENPEEYSLIVKVLEQFGLGHEAVAKTVPTGRRTIDRELNYVEEIKSRTTTLKKIVPILDIVQNEEDRATFADRFDKSQAMILMPRLHPFAISNIMVEDTKPIFWEYVLHRLGGAEPLPSNHRAPWQLQAEDYLQELDSAVTKWLQEHNIDKLVRRSRAATTVATLEAMHGKSSGLIEASDVAKQAAEDDKVEFWHRDLKPSQFLVDSEGVMRINDFGLSYMTLGEAEDSDLRTLSNLFSMGGTQLYFTPRMVQVMHHTDPGDGNRQLLSDELASRLVSFRDLTSVEDSWALAISGAVLYLHPSSPIHASNQETTLEFPFSGSFQNRLDRMYSQTYHEKTLGRFPWPLRCVLAALLVPCPDRGLSKAPPLRPDQQQTHRLLRSVLGYESLTLSRDAEQLVASLLRKPESITGLTLAEAVATKFDSLADDAHEQRVVLLTDVAIGLACHTARGQVHIRDQIEQTVAITGSGLVG